MKYLVCARNVSSEYGADQLLIVDTDKNPQGLEEAVKVLTMFPEFDSINLILSNVDPVRLTEDQKEREDIVELEGRAGEGYVKIETDNTFEVDSYGPEYFKLSVDKYSKTLMVSSEGGNAWEADYPN